MSAAKEDQFCGWAKKLLLTCHQWQYTLMLDNSSTNCMRAGPPAESCRRGRGFNVGRLCVRPTRACEISKFMKQQAEQTKLACALSLLT